MHQQQNCKKQVILWWKMAQSDTVFKNKFFWEWKEVFLKYLHNKIQLCSAAVKG